MVSGIHSGTPDSEMVSFIQVGPESVAGSGVGAGGVHHSVMGSAAAAAAAALASNAQQRSGGGGLVNAGSMANIMPEKGILKKQCPLGLGLNDGHEGQELLSNGGIGLMGGGGGNVDENEPSLPLSEVERTLKSLNGYHEDILQALRNAAHQRAAYGGSSHTLPHGVPAYNPMAGAGGSSGVSGHSVSSAASEDPMRKSFSDGYPDYGSEFSHNMRASSTSREKLDNPNQGPGQSSGQMMVGPGGQDDPTAGLGPIRIRNLEDLLRQLEGNAGRHLSPNGSEDLRPSSETEADRHYRCQYHLPGAGSAAVAQTLANMAAMAGFAPAGGSGAPASANATLVRPGSVSPPN